VAGAASLSFYPEHVSRLALSRIRLPLCRFFPALQLAVVVVGFPATPLLYSRTRFCVSAGHTKQDLDRAAEKVREVCDVLHLRYNESIIG
jgi:hypothetical protein